MAGSKREVPSFKAFKSTSQEASKAKQKNTSRDTKVELLLRRALRKVGLRYRLTVSGLPGKPDIVFTRARVAVFCDGDFWHGRNWSARREQLAKGANSTYWIAKIAYNMNRDRRHRKELQGMGWKVLRFWESQIKLSPDDVAQRVRDVVTERLRSGRLE